ncbi:MbtH family protein [Kitasatospora griseola]|uniref:MbtH family protein n=1 Tax=Kitasatospora griseola TaxID=2064 RepID=UPI0034249CA7
MPASAEDDPGVYAVVINDEEQYSIWQQEREIPAGWRATGFNGSRDACLDHIEEVWTDMTPLSLRRYLEPERSGEQCSGEPQ